MVLLDTGILLRIIDSSDPLAPLIEQAIQTLEANGRHLVTSPQNMAETWVVMTRPTTARGGFGFSLARARSSRDDLEQMVFVLPDSARTYALWRTIVDDFLVSGVNAHDARLAAFMNAYSIATVLTLNPGDFRRFTFLSILTPELVTAGAEP